MKAPREKHGEKPDLFGEAEEILNYFNRGKRFIEELLRENERLRYKVLHLEQDLETVAATGGPEDGDESLRLRNHLSSINARFDSLKKENEDFRQRYLEVQTQNENLLNLYVSGHQLHTTFRQENVLQVIKEILLNLVGAEVFALWLVDQNGGGPQLKIYNDDVGFFGGGGPPMPRDLLEEMVGGGSHYNDARGRLSGTPEEPLACIPLRLEERTLGFLAVYQLLMQKEGLTSLDHDLLGLLASQAAAALVGSMLLEGSDNGLKWLENTAGETSA